MKRGPNGNEVLGPNPGTNILTTNHILTHLPPAIERWCTKWCISSWWTSESDFVNILLTEEILHHQGCIKPRKYWDKLPINWCRISSINSITEDFVLKRFKLHMTWVQFFHAVGFNFNFYEDLRPYATFKSKGFPSQSSMWLLLQRFVASNPKRPHSLPQMSWYTGTV